MDTMGARLNIKNRFILRSAGRINVTDLMFYAAFSLVVVTLLLEETIWYSQHSAGMVPRLFSLTRYAAYLLCLVIVLMKLFKRRIVLAIIVLIVGLALSMLASTNRMMFMYAFILVGAYGVDGRKIIKLAFFWQALVLFLTILASQMGIVEDFIFDAETRMRHGLGFAWTTTPAIMYMYCVLAYIYFRNRKIKTLEYVIMLAIDVVMFMLTDARLSFVLSAVTIAGFCIAHWLHFRPSVHRNRKLIFYALPSLAALFGIAIHYFYNPANAIWASLNRLLTRRLELGHDAITDYGFSLFGTPIAWVGYSAGAEIDTYNFVDCSYLKIALEFGIITLIITVAIYTILIRKAIVNKDNYLLWVIIVILALAVTEPRLMHFAFNPFPVLLFAALGEKKTAAPAYSDAGSGALEVIQKDS